MDTPLISIVVPVYNVEETMLTKCFDSILNQSYINIELIVVDDGSKQEVADFLDQYQSTHSTIKVIHNANGGASIARNTGIEESKGEYITFVDSDDWLEVDYIETLVAKFELQTDIVMCTRIFEYKTSSVENHFFDSDIIFTLANRKDLIKKSLTSGVAGTWCKIYRKSFIDRNKLRYNPNLRRTQDIIFNIYAFQKANDIRYFNYCLYHYRMQNESITKKYNHNADIILTKAAEAFRQFEKDYYNDDSEIRECVNYKCITILNEIFKLKYFNPNHNSSNIKEEVKSLIENPVYESAIQEYNMSHYPGLLGKLKIFFLKNGMIGCLKLLYCAQHFVESRRNY